MKVDKRIFSRKNIIILCIVLSAHLFIVSTVGIVFVKVYPYIYLVFISAFEERLVQDRLLRKTDHQILLQTCRELAQQVLAGKNPEIEKYEYMIIPDSELSKYPVIRDIGAHQVTLSKVGVVTISHGGTMWHFGVRAYPQDFLQSHSNNPYRNKELIPGLWYYDDRYNRREDYDRVIEKLLQRNKYR